MTGLARFINDYRGQNLQISRFGKPAQKSTTPWFAVNRVRNSMLWKTSGSLPPPAASLCLVRCPQKPELCAQARAFLWSWDTLLEAGCDVPGCPRTRVAFILWEGISPSVSPASRLATKGNTSPSSQKSQEGSEEWKGWDCWEGWQGRQTERSSRWRTSWGWRWWVSDLERDVLKILH